MSLEGTAECVNDIETTFGYLLAGRPSVLGGQPPNPRDFFRHRSGVQTTENGCNPLHVQRSLFQWLAFQWLASHAGRVTWNDSSNDTVIASSVFCRDSTEFFFVGPYGR